MAFVWGPALGVLGSESSWRGFISGKDRKSPATFPKAVMIAAESMVVQQGPKWWPLARPPADQGVICGDAVGEQEKYRQTRRPMVVSEVRLAIKCLKEPTLGIRRLKDPIAGDSLTIEIRIDPSRKSAATVKRHPKWWLISGHTRRWVGIVKLFGRQGGLRR